MSILRKAAKSLLSRAGVRCYRVQHLPVGADWAWDVAREYGGAERIRTVLDVGANVGVVSKHLNDVFPNAVVHAFEPVRSTYETLCSSVARYPRIKPHNVAAGESEGAVRMTCEANAEHNRISAQGGEEAQVVRLDRYLEGLGVSGVDILKSDTEGFDIGVVKGAGRLVSEAQIPFILVECGLDPLGWHTPLSEFKSLLGGYGYHLYALYDITHTSELPRRIFFMNALFVSPRVGRDSR